MGRRSAQSVLKRAREQALREKRELKHAKKDARAAERRRVEDPSVEVTAVDPSVEVTDVDPSFEVTDVDADAGEAA